MSLRLRLALLFAVAAALVITVAGFGYVWQLRPGLDASLDPGLRARVTTIANDFGASDGQPGRLRVQRADEIVQVWGPDGRLLAASHDAGTGALLDAPQRRQALAGEVSFTTTVDGDRSRLLATTVPSAGDRLLVVVGVPTDVSDDAVGNVQAALLVGGPIAAVLAGLAAWLLAGAALRPVERMRRQAAEISDRDIDRRLVVPGTRDEIAALGNTLNALLDRLQGALDRQRGFVADAGHELRTPLAILRTELELAARPGRSRDDLVEAVEQAGQETERLIRLAEDLLLLARLDNAQPVLRPVERALPALLRTTARGAEMTAVDRGISVLVEVPDELVVTADPDRLRQLVDNLLDNAVRYAPPGSTVQLTAHRVDGTLTIDVADRGPGFPEEFLPHAFERFRRAETARSRDAGGSGLGLSIVRAIAQAHGGSAEAGNRPDGGAVVTVRLPAALVPPPTPEP